MKAKEKSKDANNAGKASGKEKESKSGKKKQMPYEWRRIDYFFEWFPVDYGREQLWEMLKLALTFDDEGPEGHDRSNMISLYEYTIELYENIFTLLEKKKEKYDKN